MLPHYANSGQSRTIVFPEGPKADGWFRVANLFKKVLIGANRALSRKQKVTPHTCTLKVSNNLSFADAIRGRVWKIEKFYFEGLEMSRLWVLGCVCCCDRGTEWEWNTVGVIRLCLIRRCGKPQLWEQRRGLAMLRCISRG